MTIMILLAAASIASICSAGGEMTVWMHNAKLTESRPVAVDVAADAIVGDLAQALLRSDAQIPGLAKGYITAKAIKIIYQGQELGEKDSLADAGVCAESSISYEVNEAELVTDLTVHRPLHIPVGHPDAIGLMVQQIHDYLGITIPNRYVVKFSFYKTGNTTLSPLPRGSIIDQMAEVQVSKSGEPHSAVVVEGKVRVVEMGLLDGASGFNWQKYDNADAAAKKMRWRNEWINVIEKPTIWEKFSKSGRAVGEFKLYHLVGAEKQNADAIKSALETQPFPNMLTVNVWVSHEFTFLFDAEVPAEGRLV